MTNKRQNKIREIIQTQDVSTQQELVERLHAAGFPVTQATVSRDIRQMKLTKMPGENGLRCYRMSTDTHAETTEHDREVFQRACLSVADAGQIVVIRTRAGMAMALAAVIDRLHIPEIAGCIAGDDTIFAACAGPEQAVSAAGQLRSLLNMEP